MNLALLRIRAACWPRAIAIASTLHASGVAEANHDLGGAGTPARQRAPTAHCEPA
ncbi:hypothetical protein N7373_16015 [Achromobacter mucicolens]|uniref:hypothetical protein n=1 Tax=Achromobacter mucicolens TaxID=1389922 RepID=UPI00244B05F3|nr:hypothetical protein [Achromobacter mucicolens]MDH0092959.1 hypothetical protein [Achromobacter mucicolens]